MANHPRHTTVARDVVWCLGGAQAGVFGICVEAYSGTDDNDACLFRQHNNIEALVDKLVTILDIRMECLTCYFAITI